MKKHLYIQIFLIFVSIIFPALISINEGMEVLNVLFFYSFWLWSLIMLYMWIYNIVLFIFPVVFTILIYAINFYILKKNNIIISYCLLLIFLLVNIISWFFVDIISSL